MLFNIENVSFRLLIVFFIWFSPFYFHLMPLLSLSCLFLTFDLPWKLSTFAWVEDKLQQRNSGSHIWLIRKVILKTTQRVVASLRSKVWMRGTGHGACSGEDGSGFKSAKYCTIRQRAAEPPHPKKIYLKHPFPFLVGLIWKEMDWGQKPTTGERWTVEKGQREEWKGNTVLNDKSNFQL